MIKTEFYMTRDDGVNLYFTYSDSDVKIKQEETGFIFDDVVDVENSGYTYTETDIPSDSKHSKEQSDLEEILDIILGGTEE